MGGSISFPPWALTGGPRSCGRPAPTEQCSSVAVPPYPRKQDRAVLFGSIGLVELLSFFTIGRAQGKRLEQFGHLTSSIRAPGNLLTGLRTRASPTKPN